ncbi:hypothetical protein DIPPA_05240 [Diplonema papillatum]|nr:hypothetical protein DIPPA_28223 [Diplonema papillatum]KAJ9471461.1 hypothetical protein DIPPA_05240 [Diplonema papillatum]
MGKSLSMNIFATAPFRRPTSSASLLTGPPTTLMYRMPLSKFHSRRATPVKLYRISFRSRHRTTCCPVTTSRLHSSFFGIRSMSLCFIS